MVKDIVLLLVIGLWTCVPGGTLALPREPQYACPTESWCVPSEYCDVKQVVYKYSATDDEQKPVKYLCGATSDSAGTVCCSNQTKLPTSFTPTSTNWFYMDESSGRERVPVLVVAWPGYGAQEMPPELVPDPSLCPPSSVCTPPTVCPSSSITYSGLLSYSITKKKYLCGSTWDTRTWTCCSTHTLVNALVAYKNSQRSPDDDDDDEADQAVVINVNFGLQMANKPPDPEVFGFRLSTDRLHTRDESYEDSKDQNLVKMLDYESEQANELADAYLLASGLKKRTRRQASAGEENVGVYASSSATGEETRYTVTPAGSIQNASRLDVVTGRSRDGIPVEKGCGRSLAPTYTARAKLESDASAAKEGQYPWHVAILTKGREYLCGGVVIADKYVLTVAHCVQHLDPSNVLVRVGDYDLSKQEESYPSYDVTVVRITCHPDYKKSSLKADLAVVEVQYPMLSLPNVARVCLPEEVVSKEEECYVPSWGFVSPPKDGSERLNSFAPILRHSRLVIIDHHKCQRHFRNVKSLGSFFKLLPGFLCCKGILQTDTCHGDGGSGLVCRSPKGEFVLKGLVSWGVACDRGLPTAFVDVRYYLQFIYDTVDAVTFQLYFNHYGTHTATASTGTNTIHATSSVHSGSGYVATTHSAGTQHGGSGYVASSHSAGTQHAGSGYVATTHGSGTQHSGSGYVASSHSAGTQHGSGYVASSHSAGTQHGGSGYVASSHSAGTQHAGSGYVATTHGSGTQHSGSGYVASSHSAGTEHGSGYVASSHSAGTQHGASGYVASSHSAGTQHGASGYVATSHSAGTQHGGSGYAATSHSAGTQHGGSGYVATTHGSGTQHSGSGYVASSHTSGTQHSGSGYVATSHSSGTQHGGAGYTGAGHVGNAFAAHGSGQGSFAGPGGALPTLVTGYVAYSDPYLTGVVKGVDDPSPPSGYSTGEYPGLLGYDYVADDDADEHYPQLPPPGYRGERYPPFYKHYDRYDKGGKGSYYYPPGYEHDKEDFPPGYKHDKVRYPPGYKHDKDRYPPGYEHDKEDFPPGYKLDKVRYPPGYKHDNDRYPPGYKHDRKDYPPGYKHDKENYSPGNKHDKEDYSQSYKNDKFDYLPGYKHEKDHRPGYKHDRYYPPGYKHDDDDDHYPPGYKHDDDDDHYPPGYKHDDDDDHYPPGYKHDDDDDHYPPGYKHDDDDDHYPPGYKHDDDDDHYPPGYKHDDDDDHYPPGYKHDDDDDHYPPGY
ncbi:uncharacterized protein [Panulirus ornatus]|uniref:uncharacterized protein n=1 Tax=Panulirus ornatus TaxID=150431 RepID=UPI003A86DB10